jgi:hypothetical protein
MAEMMAELQQLRGTVRTLQGRINEQPATPAPAAEPTIIPRDLGEIVKLLLPAPFYGQSADVLPFLT